MGSNGSYCKLYDGVPGERRTHTDTQLRVGGHKVLVSKENNEHDKGTVTSNSRSPTYLFAAVKKDGTIVISSIGRFDNHEIVESVDLKFDSEWNVLPYGAKGSHSHKWGYLPSGSIGRKKHDKTNEFPIPDKYNGLIEKIVEFNKSIHKWTRTRS